MPKCNSIKLLCNFIEIAFRHGCSFVHLLHIFRMTFLNNNYEDLGLTLVRINPKKIKEPNVLRDLVPFLLSKKHEKCPRRSFTFSKVAG